MMKSGCKINFFTIIKTDNNDEGNYADCSNSLNNQDCEALILGQNKTLPY